MARNTLHPDPHLADLEALQIDLVSPTPEAFLDRLRLQNRALDRLRCGLAAEEVLVASDVQVLRAG